MSRARRIALNSTWLLISQLLPFIASIFVVGYVARGLGEEGFGLLEGALAMASMCSPIVFAGIHIILVREIVKDPSRGPTAVGDALVIRLLLLPLFAGVVFLVTPAVIPRELVLIAIGTYFFMMYSQSWALGFEAAERMHFIAIANLTVAAVGLTLSVLAVRHGLGPEGVAGARGSGQVAAFLLLTVALPITLYRPKIQVDVRRWLRILKMGLPLAVPYLLGLVLLEIDKGMILWILGPEEGPAANGQYSSVTVLAYKFDMIIISFATAVTPALVATWNESKESYQRLMGGALRVGLLLGLPVAIGTGFIARDVIDLIFGAEYLRSSTTLSVIIWFVPLQFVNRIMAVSLGATEREKWVMWCISATAAFNVAVNAVLIPMWGYEGAAIATVASEVLLFVLNVVVQRKDTLAILRFMKLFRVLFAMGLLYGVCFLLREQHALVILGGAIVAYGVLVVATRCVSKDDVRTILGR